MGINSETPVTEYVNDTDVETDELAALRSSPTALSQRRKTARNSFHEIPPRIYVLLGDRSPAFIRTSPSKADAFQLRDTPLCDDNSGARSPTPLAN